MHVTCLRTLGHDVTCCIVSGLTKSGSILRDDTAGSALIESADSAGSDWRIVFFYDKYLRTTVESTIHTRLPVLHNCIYFKSYQSNVKTITN